MADEELSRIERLASVGDKTGADLYRLGVAELRAHRRPEARSYFSRALELVDGDSGEAQDIVTKFPDLSYKRLEWGLVPRRGNAGRKLMTWEQTSDYLKEWRLPTEREIVSFHLAKRRRELDGQEEKYPPYDWRYKSERFWVGALYRFEHGYVERQEVGKEDCSRFAWTPSDGLKDFSQWSVGVIGIGLDEKDSADYRYGSLFLPQPISQKWYPLTVRGQRFEAGGAVANKAGVFPVRPRKISQ